MIYSGLENDYYLVDNPIYLTFNGNQSLPPENYNLFVNIGGYANYIQMHNGIAIVDIAPIVKSLMNLPNFFNQSNIIKLSATASYFDENQQMGIIDDVFINKRFIRGSRYTGTNNHLSNGTILKTVDKLPKWGDYPVRKYTISGDSILEQNPTESEVETMRKRSCDCVYLAFLNRLGGYSYYLFEISSINQNSESSTIIENKNRDIAFAGGIDYHNNFTQLSANGEYNLTVESRVEKRHYNLMRDLVSASEVLVYDFDKIIGSDFNFGAQRWTKLINQGNSFNVNLEDEVTDVSFSFRTMLTKNNKVNA